jgi:predicted ATP-dependent serine protease
MSLSICNSNIDKIFFSKLNKILIYGEAAVGKTNLLLNIIKCSVDKLASNEVIYFISTEGSTFLEKFRKLKLVNEKVLVSIAIDQLHLITMLIDIIREINKRYPLCIIIDGINSHYRVESSTTEGMIFFTEILTLLDSLSNSGSYVISSAQVRSINGKQEVPGQEYLQHWADVVAYISRDHPFYRVFKFYKPPIDKVYYFDIKFDGVRWITMGLHSIER